VKGHSDLVGNESDRATGEEGLLTRITTAWRVALALAVAALAIGVAAASAPARNAQGPPDRLTIAYQPGIGYTPLIIMKEQRAIERRWPGTRVEWKVLASGAAITNGVIAGDIHVGAGGVGPLLVGWARGVNWKFLAPLNEGDLWLMARDPNIRTIGDLRGKRIAMPSPTSIQAVALRKMAQVKLGDANALDRGIISMDHPDGMQALLSGQVDAHLTSPPFQFQEKIRGAHVVARSYNYFGAHSFLGVMVTQKFYDDHTDFARWFYRQVAAANVMIKKNPTKVAKILEKDAGGNPTWRQFKQWIANPALKYSTRPRGLMRFAVFMNRIGMINRMPGSWKDLVFPPVHATRGS
jgi:NitT/TauT family transport system substrate-binding protein